MSLGIRKPPPWRRLVVKAGTAPAIQKIVDETIACFPELRPPSAVAPFHVEMPEPEPDPELDAMKIKPGFGRF